MKRLFLIASILIPTLSAAAGENVLIYRPETVTGQLPSSPEEGIAVRTLTIKRGDSLSKLARRYAGKGYYFPQILLFNRIADPNRIIAGENIRVPIPPSPHTVTSPAPSEPQPTAAVITAPAAAVISPATGDQELFTRAIAQYRKRHYRTALALFDRYLREYPESPRASDALLRRGECYLKLSRR